MDVKIICQQAAHKIGYSELKRQQLDAMVKLVSGKDVYVVLPMGFVKSLIYTTLPWVYDSLLATDYSMIVVVSPLTAIMKDQISFK